VGASIDMGLPFVGAQPLLQVRPQVGLDSAASGALARL